ncbi:MAG TPA: carboxypeptidase-like regulatory domain-containing protein [Atribacteraceae bacterium]|nr:carboxypeptidase-like regulatory domain-containing protein [Atribacteraceae bacterium]
MKLCRNGIVLCLALAGVLVGVALLAGCVRWQEKTVGFYVYAMEPFSVEGYVLPLFGARVAIAGGVSLTLYTNSHGKAVTQLPPGTYQVTASHSGYSPVNRVITLYTLDLGPLYYDFQLAPTGG